METPFPMAAIPQGYEIYAVCIIIFCKLLTVFIRPPAPTSHWAPVFQIITTIALNIGWASNRLQIGKTGIMVARDKAAEAKQAVIAAGLTPAPKAAPSP